MPGRFATSCVLLIVLSTGIFLLRCPGKTQGVSSFIGEMPETSEDYYSSDQSQAQTVRNASQPSGFLHGTVVDEDNSPVHSVEVELIPTDKTGDQRWYATKHDWTNHNGEYQFQDVKPGEYFLAVQVHAAPDGRHPFAGVYYPSADDEAGADRLLVTTESLELAPTHLRRIETATLKVGVAFQDGTSPKWSNLLFYNPSYPDQGVIGDEAPGIENGQGQITLPKGFKYYARAKVDCAAGSKIETRESRPVLQIEIANDVTPSEVVFIIPGPACQLWSPK